MRRGASAAARYSACIEMGPSAAAGAQRMHNDASTRPYTQVHCLRILRACISTFLDDTFTMAIHHRVFASMHRRHARSLPACFATEQALDACMAAEHQHGPCQVQLGVPGQAGRRGVLPDQARTMSTPRTMRCSLNMRSTGSLGMMCRISVRTRPAEAPHPQNIHAHLPHAYARASWPRSPDLAQILTGQGPSLSLACIMQRMCTAPSMDGRSCHNCRCASHACNMLPHMHGSSGKLHAMDTASSVIFKHTWLHACMPDVHYT